MAKKKKYLITHSNYTVKQTHKKLDSNRTIFERDYTVLNGVGNFSEEGIFNGLSTFKMVTRNVPNGTKKHDYGSWLTTDACGDESETWTMNCLKNTTTSDLENKIKLKPNYESLLSFAYYGGCRELLQTTLKHIIKKYPAELCFSSQKHESNNYIINNVLNIDLVTIKKFNNSSIEDLNVFSESAGAYEVLDADENSLGPVTMYEISNKVDIRCLKDGDKICTSTVTYGDGSTFNFHIYKKDDGNVITCPNNFEAYRIRPKKEYIDKFFDELSDFENMVLNRDSVPSYTMRLDYPHETEYGIETYKKKFILPKEIVYKGDEKKNGWNINITNGAYDNYISELLKVCDFYDERRTDNLWRSMTHDSIKNMDTSFDRGGVEDDEDYQIGATRMKKIFSIFGRFFDDIKRYIDNIKNINNVSYNGGNNVPDYFLSDKLETSGWEVCTTSPNIDDSVKIGNLYSGNVRKYSSTDANIQFMKTLLLNSKHILAHKGTKRGIEMLLALFGLRSQNMVNRDELKEYKDKVERGENFEYPPYDYKIDEYVSVVKGVSEEPILSTNTLKVEKYNSWRNDYGAESGIDSLRGLPVRMVEYIDGDNNIYKYIIPWFDKLQDVNGSPYFQMYGGWCKIPKRKIKNKYAPSISNIITSDIDSIYEETIKYIRIVKTVDELTTISDDAKKKGVIFYVINNGGWQLYGEDKKEENISNYFILKNPLNYYDVESENRGWENIPLSDIENGENDGFKVLYLESIMDDHKGNNPHGGDYDDGREYIEYFKKLFKYTIENNGFNNEAFDCETGELDKGIEECGFKLDDYVIDNVKTWYYTDTNGINDLFILKKDEYGKYEEDINNPFPEVGVDNVNNYFENDLHPFNFEGGETNDEASANSLINIKNLTIDFNGQCTAYSEFYDYFIKSILPFLKQMIPSTTIVNIKVKDATTKKVNKTAALKVGAAIK